MLNETRSRPIQHENCFGWAWKCRMKNLFAIKFSNKTISLHLTWFFLFCYFCVLLSRSNISFNMAFVMLDEMLDWFNKSLNLDGLLLVYRNYAHFQLTNFSTNFWRIFFPQNILLLTFVHWVRFSLW